MCGPWSNRRWVVFSRRLGPTNPFLCEDSTTCRMTIAVSVLLASVCCFAHSSATCGSAKVRVGSCGTPPGTIMTKDYVAMVGRLAYVWGWPLVNNLNRSLAMANLPEPGAWAYRPRVTARLRLDATDYIDAGERFVTCPNQDTVDGAGFQRLDSSLSSSRFRISENAFSHTKSPTPAPTRLPLLASSTKPSQATTCWLARIGRGGSPKASTLSSVHRRTSRPSCPGFSKTTRLRTKRPSSAS